MLPKRGYLIHFARLFFSSLLFGICLLFSHLWNVYQPFHFTFQLQQCQSTLSNTKILHINIFNWLNDFNFLHLLPSFSFLSTSKCHLYIKTDYPLNIPKLIEYFRSILLIYFVYHLISLFIFHIHFKQIQSKQIYYARLYRQDQKNRKSRCSNRLLQT